MQIAAIIPTRGDVDLGPIVNRLRQYPEVREIIIEIGDTVFNRYAAAAKASFQIIYTQDDDCLTDLRPLIEAYHRGMIVNAMTPEHQRNYANAGRLDTLIGFGAIFDRYLVAVLDGWERDELFLRECDRIFTSLIPHHTVYPEIEILNCACNGNRLYRQPEHLQYGDEIRRRIEAFLRNHDA